MGHVDDHEIIKFNYRKLENIEALLKLLNINYMPLLKSLESENIEKKEIPDQIKILEKRIDNLESKLKELEFKINLHSDMRKILPYIERYIKQTFDNINYIKYVGYEIYNDVIYVIVVHSNEDRVEALEEITNKMIELEDAFPDIHFELQLIYNSKVDNLLTKNAKTLINRE